ncbi:MAG: inactive transglutaminase family protein, partial [Congregibacter sp.]|nr:inactive transglutaminase family protein [Congregibacter sp.]
MVASRTQIGLIAGGLIIFGLGLTLYKSLSLGLPLLPERYQDVWTIEAKISFYPTQGPVEVSFALPERNNAWVTLNENFASSGFGFTVDTQGAVRDAKWSKQTVSDFTTVYYKAQVYHQDGDRTPQGLSTELTQLPRLTETQAKAFELFVAQLREKSTSESTFAKLLLEAFASENNQDVEFILSDLHEGRVDAMRYLLTYAGIPSHFLRGIQLEDGRRRQTLSTLLEAFVDKEWLVLNPADGTAGMPENFFPWRRSEDSILTVVGGEKSSLEFALVQNSVPIRTVVSMEQRSEEFALLDFSIYALPVEQQGIFTGLLLIPV